MLESWSRNQSVVVKSSETMASSPAPHKPSLYLDRVTCLKCKYDQVTLCLCLSTHPTALMRTVFSSTWLQGPRDLAWPPVQPDSSSLPLPPAKALHWVPSTLNLTHFLTHALCPHTPGALHPSFLKCILLYPPHHPLFIWVT